MQIFPWVRVCAAPAQHRGLNVEELFGTVHMSCAVCGASISDYQEKLLYNLILPGTMYLDFYEWTPRQIQDIYSGLPHGHTVNRDVVDVRAASLFLSHPPYS